MFVFNGQFIDLIISAQDEPSKVKPYNALMFKKISQNLNRVAGLAESSRTATLSTLKKLCNTLLLKMTALKIFSMKQNSFIKIEVTDKDVKIMIRLKNELVLVLVLEMLSYNQGETLITLLCHGFPFPKLLP